jgi:tetratricopeptide (TPR) repeat protein
VIPEGVDWQQLDRQARARLRTLSKANAEVVGAHLVMAGRLMDENADLAYEHAQAAVRRAGRVDVVREAAALTGYASGRYAEALRELRTVRRLSGVDAHRAIEADCERGLGRPDRALTILAEAPAPTTAEERAELALVEAGARTDLGELEAALSVLEQVPTAKLDADVADRLDEAKHDVLVALGRAEPRDLPAVDEAGQDGSAEPDEDVVGIDDVLEEDE